MSMAILILSGCGNRQEEAKGENTLENISQTVVKPPKADLHSATFLGDLDAVNQHIQAGSDLDVPEPSMNSTALISAAFFGKTDVARALIEGGADVDIQNNEGSTALHSAAFLCRTEIVKMLLDAGADKELLNVYGSTALQSVAGPFEEVKPIYDEFSKILGPLGFKLDYKHVEKTRPLIASMLR